MVDSVAAWTIPQIIRQNCRRWPKRTAMCVKSFGIWQQYSWGEYYDRVKYLSLGLRDLGLERGDVVCLIGDNEPEWFWGEFAAQAAGAVATGIFVDSIPSEVKYVASHAGARFAIVNDQEQTDKFLEIKNELPMLQTVVYWDPKGLKNYDDPTLISFDEVVRRGRSYEEAHPGAFEEALEVGTDSDVAFIYYTSGTTGLPKGALLTHRALIATACGFLSRYRLGQEDDLVSHFPAAWVGDSYFATIPHLLTGARLNFPEEPETVAEDTREVGPNFAIYGPRQWEGLVREVQVKMLDAHPLKRFCYNIFLPVGHRVGDMRLEGQRPGLPWRLLYRLADAMVFRPLRDKLGLSRVRFAVTGSSVLSLDTFRLLHAIGIELRQVYASTEAGLISSHSEGEIAYQSVGRPSRGIELRLTDEGELLVRSDAMFEGYHRDTEKTAEVLRDGWCHTGDAVNIDEAGHVIFLDRLDHMGELRSGAKYAPQYVEGRLRFSPYIKDAMVIGGRDKDFVSAIINIDFGMVGKWAEQKGLPYTTFADLSQRPEVADLVEGDLLRVNSYLPEPAQVKRFVLLHKEFDPDESELTRTRKLRREFMVDRYRELIRGIYGGGQEIKVDAAVTYRDGRKGTVTTAIKIRSVDGGSNR
ncbi:MAG: AMP-binding protein [Chloroflexota bacterium]